MQRVVWILRAVFDPWNLGYQIWAIAVIVAFVFATKYLAHRAGLDAPWPGLMMIAAIVLGWVFATWTARRVYLRFGVRPFDSLFEIFD